MRAPAQAHAATELASSGPGLSSTPTAHDAATPQPAPDAEGWIWLPENVFRTAFAQHSTPTQQRALAAAQRPIAPACIAVPVGRPLWHDVPAWYLVAETTA
ncbi:hypothetical protein [Nocardia stercoris]|uniref:Uncharacterized protein n=1 Tax=Nocardia stercoris TaxID=2483361 RepID=A0A3M2KUV0_9NOCA|nr:hypothetical protein [Nocardia stercoris]RMI28931.1 hypothetical protein EBN03_27705 [Nocardia stercoris]